MSNFLDITLLQRLDDSIFTSGYAAKTIVLNVKNQYASGLLPQFTLNAGDMDTDTFNALKKVFDYVYFQLENNCKIVDVAYNAAGKEFDLTGSYLRNSVSTAAPAALADGTPIDVIFEFAGFIENVYIKVTALYNQAFSSTDLALLSANGITLRGNGDVFSITNTRDCRVLFAKPESESGQYVIQYPDVLTIIPAT